MNDFGRSLRDCNTNYIAPVENFARTFGVDVPTREDWADGCFIRDGDISVPLMVRGQGSFN